jgi:signal transduction histidine kinase
MRIAASLVLAFGGLTAASTAVLGYVVRSTLSSEETAHFERDVRRACDRATQELREQAERDRQLVAGACQGGELVERTVMAMDRGEFGAWAPGKVVPNVRASFDLHELVLVDSEGTLHGADPVALLGMPKPEVEQTARIDAAKFVLRRPTHERPAAIVVGCTRTTRDGRKVALVGARHLAPLFARLSRSSDVQITGSTTAAAMTRQTARASCNLVDAAGASVPIVVTKSKAELDAKLARIDEAVLYATIASTGIALLLAALVARRLGRPIEVLATEARKVATEQAQPLRVKGSGEIAELGAAFDKMLEDLAATRRRLAATNRIAAWREVARRVAHEVKNPLAPIRAAVETLRRLRARNDPAFDEYFDEATRTVLDEVHRISNIVTEFTRFARLPPPRPQVVDVEDVVKHVLQLHRADAKGAALAFEVRRTPPRVRADRDQVVQVLTNLVQNALDAVRDRPGAAVTVTLDGDAERAVVAVADNGPGIATEIAARLFEPYATTKAHGTGLGLAIAQRIAVEHGGELAYVGRSPAGGALFRLILTVEGPPPMSETPPTSD